MTELPDRPQQTVIYLAQPQEPDTLLDLWAVDVVTDLHAEGYTVYRPAQAWVPAHSPLDPRVALTNRFLLTRADVVVALVPTASPGADVGADIEAARSRRIPVVVLTNSAYAMDGLGDGLVVTHLAGSVAPLVVQALAEAKPVDRVNSFSVPTQYRRDVYSVHALHNQVIPSGALVEVESDGELDTGDGPGVAVILGRPAEWAGTKLLVVPTVHMDAGPVSVPIHNLGDEAVTIHAGELIARLVIHSTTSP